MFNTYKKYEENLG